SKDDGLVSVIDTSTDAVINAIDLGVGSLPTGVAVDSAGTRVYVADADGVDVIDTTSQAVVANIPIPEVGYAGAVDPSGSHVYTGNAVNGITGFNRSVSMIDVSTNTVTDTVLLPGAPYGIEVDPTGGSVYVGVGDIARVVRIDTATKTIAATSAVL